MGGNQLQDLPAEIGQLTNLETLDVGFDVCSCCIIHLTYIEQVAGNKLKHLPSEISQLDKLQDLHVRPRLF